MAAGNELLLTQWLRTTQIYYLTRSLGQNECVSRAALHSEAWGESAFLPFPAFSGCPHSLAHGPLPPSSKSAMPNLPDPPSVITFTSLIPDGNGFLVFKDSYD